MKLDTNSTAMTVLLALMTALGPVTMNIYVASLPHIATAFAASAGTVQFTLSLYLVGFAAGQIVYGPMSDAFGRRPMLLTGFLIYLISTAVCAMAWSIEALIAARFFQAFGAAGPIIITRAVVRDLHSGSRAAKQLSMMSAIAGVAPISSPILGGILQAAFDWRASFIAMGIFASILALAGLALLPETNTRTKGATAISPRGIYNSFRIVAASPVYRVYLVMTALSYCGFFAFTSGSSHVLQHVFGLDPIQFGTAFALCSLSYILGNASGVRLTPILRLEGMLHLGAWTTFAGGLLCIAGYVAFPDRFIAFLIPVMVFFIGIGFLVPQLVAAAMTPFPDRAGAASSLTGFTQMGSGAIVGLVLGYFLGDTAWPLVIAIAAISTATFTVFALSKNLRATARHSRDQQ